MTSKLDKNNMKKVLESFPMQCEEALKLGRGIKVKNINKVIITGIGGSAFSGDVLKTIIGEEIDIFVNRDYYLPKKIDRRTLVFVVSYSGDTEEPLYAIKDAIKNRCKTIGISSNGRLEKICKKNKFDFIKVPSGIEPRNAMGYLVIPMVNVLQGSKLIKRKFFKKVIGDLKSKKIKNQGKKIANLLYKKIPLVYSSEKLKWISYGFKTRLNENSKILAFAHQIPELNHNELVGYTQHYKKSAGQEKKIADDFYTIIIKDKDDFYRNKKRFFITKKIIKKYKGQCTIIDTIGSSFVSRVFCTLHLADWASYYLALKNKVDPAPVRIIDYLKKELNK